MYVDIRCINTVLANLNMCGRVCLHVRSYFYKQHLCLCAHTRFVCAYLHRTSSELID